MGTFGFVFRLARGVHMAAVAARLAALSGEFGVVGGVAVDPGE